MLAAVAALGLSALTGKPPPPPPAPSGIAFDFSVGSGMVLQQAPAKACVTGTLGGGTSATVKISPAEDDTSAGYEVVADVAADGQFKACLKPTPAGGSFTLTATCVGCSVGNKTATVSDVTFGWVHFSLIFLLASLCGLAEPCWSGSLLAFACRR
jgi:hypothetical protein